MLARRQTEYVSDRLRARWPEVEIEFVEVETRGDQITDRPLPEIGGKGLFTEALAEALRNTSIDFAVHSMKDLPTEETPGLAIGAVPDRADPRDVFYAKSGRSLSAIAGGAVVGTSSVRRVAQVLMARSDLEIRAIRGNVPTRVRKVDDGMYDAVVLAAAGFVRLGMQHLVTQYLEISEFLPAPAQGALAVQCRSDDSRMMRLLAEIDDRDARDATTAERTLLARLQAGCSSPVGAYALRKNGHVRMTAAVLARDGSSAVRVEGHDENPVALGERLADSALERGATALMQDVR